MFELSLPNLVLLYMACPLALALGVMLWTQMQQRRIRARLLHGLVFCRGCHVTYRTPDEGAVPRDQEKGRSREETAIRARLSRCPACHRVNDRNYGLPTHTA